MANITFSEGSGVNDSVFGKSQEPIKLFLQKRSEAFENSGAVNHLFVKTPSNNFAEKYTSMTSMDDFTPSGENGDYPVTGMQESYSKVIENVEWKSSFSISQTIMEDSKLMDLRSKPEAFITSFHRTKERFAAALYGGAIGAKENAVFGGHSFGLTCADEKKLFATDHPQKLNSGKTAFNQSNVATDAFSNDALMAAQSHMQSFKGDNDEYLDVMPNTIVIPNDYKMKKSVFAAIGADKDPATANNGANFTFGMWNVLIWQELNRYIGSSSMPWMLIDEEYLKTYMAAPWQDRVELTVKSDIAPNDANIWKGRARYNAGFVDWRYVMLCGASSGSTLIPA